MKVTLKEFHHEADNIITFWFKPESEISYSAGQYIEMTLPHKNPDDRGIKRWFTLSSSPTDKPLISITTKFAAKPSSFKTKLRQLNPGDEVTISSPMGDFILPKDSLIPLVFVAGGIGITPFHSIVKFLEDSKQERQIQLLYATSSEDELIFQDIWRSYQFSNFIPIIDKPLKPWTGETGNLTAQRILELSGGIKNKLIYTSGPESMVETFIDGLGKLGVAKNQLVGDYFPNYSVI